MFSLLLIPAAVAYPSSWTCDYSCISALSDGDSFGQMSIDSFSAITGSADCSISHNIPTDGFIAGNDYTLTVSMASSGGEDLAPFGVASDDTQFQSNSATSSYSATWTATSDSEMSFRFACGRGGTVEEIYLSDTLTVSASSATTTTSTTALDTATTCDADAANDCYLALDSTPCFDAAIACGTDVNCFYDLYCGEESVCMDYYNAALACLDGCEDDSTIQSTYAGLQQALDDFETTYCQESDGASHTASASIFALAAAVHALFQ